MKITLTEHEQRIAKFLAKERYDVNRENNVHDAKKGEQSNEFVDLEGIAGEMAFCKLFNVYPDLEIKVTTQETDAGDCVLNGHKVDVKTTSYETGRLICATWKNDDVDVYALMVGQFPTYSFRGMANASYLKQESNITDLGRGKVYALEQSKLKYPNNYDNIGENQESGSRDNGF